MGREGKLWYIPHHRVCHPTKGKLRVVYMYDCADMYTGCCLNDELIQGPDCIFQVFEMKKKKI